MTGGLQRERTQLGWERTAFSFMAVGILLGFRSREALAPGHAFSIEPGIYIPGRWGARLEDIVVAAAAGPDALNVVDHSLCVVDG